MKNRLLHTVLIVAAVLASLALVAFLALTLAGGKLNEAFDLATLFGRGTTEAATEATEPTETLPPMTLPTETGEASSSGETSSETEESSSEPEAASRVIRVGVESLYGEKNPLKAASDGDRALAELTQLSLLTLDREGRIVLKAASGETRPYEGEDYRYVGPVDVTSEYDAEGNLTTYTLELRKDIYFSDGVQMTIDDVIFNYYLRLQPDYTGSGELRSYPILGLDNYYYNNAQAERQTVSAAELAAELEAPSEETKSYIRRLIAEVLEAEAVTCSSLWTTYQAYGYGNSAQELFYNLYGRDLNYNLVGKSLEQVCADVIASYELDYRALAENYAVDADYFDSRVEEYVRELLLFRKIRELPEDPVSSISGILRMNRFSMKLKVYGRDENALYDLLDFEILPLHYYGDPSAYDYNGESFGFIPGHYDLTDTELPPLGAGPFAYLTEELPYVYLVPNGYYYGEKAQLDFLVLSEVGSQMLSALENGTIDIAGIGGSKKVWDALCEANPEDTPSGSKFYMREADNLGYCYIGINAENVSVGGEPYSEASLALRRALATAIASFRDTAYVPYFGESVSLIDYPVSTFFDIAPEAGDPEYRRIFSVKADGTPVYTDDMSTIERAGAVIEAVREYLEIAGYTGEVDNEGHFAFTQAPDGASLMYEVVVCGDEYTTHPSYEALAYAKTCLNQLGITLDIHYMSSEENMLISIYMGSCSLWCASWNGSNGPDLENHYLGKARPSTAVPNIYGLADDRIDELLMRARTADPQETVWLYRQIFELVEEWAVEIPCYQLHTYYIYNAETLDPATLPEKLSPYRSWTADLNLIRVRSVDEQ